MERHEPQAVPVADLAARAASQAELAAALRGQLARAARWEEPPSFELLEAAVDGRLDADAAAAFAARLADDDQLRQEVADLVALRDRPTRRAQPETARPAGHRSRWLGVAAALLLALLGVEAMRHRTSAPAPQGEELAASQQPAAPGERLFSDDFESGDAARWSKH